MTESSRLRDLARDIDYLLTAIKYRVVYYMEDYKVFTGTMVNMLLTFTGYYVLWSVILSNTDTYRGYYNVWGIGYIVMLIGFSELAFALDALITYGLAYIPRIIHEEGLEAYSIYPVSPLTVILGKHSEPIDGFSGITWSTVFIALAHWIYGVPVSLIGIFLGLLGLILGLAAITSIYLLLASLSFRFGMLEAPLDFVTTVYVSFSRVPHDVFPGIVRNILTFLLPVAMLSTFPTLITTGVVDTVAYAKLLAGVLLTTLTLAFAAGHAWRRGMAAYQPAGG